MGPGSWTLYDTTSCYAVDNPERVQHLIVMVPKAPLIERGLNLRTLTARPFGGVSGGSGGSGTSGIARVALSTMRSTFQELPHMSEAAARGAGELIAQLVRLLLIELAGQATAVTQREALKDRIRAYVVQRLRDPQLSIEQIATALNCSKRHLHNTFVDGTDTLASYILQQRLQACMRALQHSGPGAPPITDIALSWGFNNLSHFSRVFRAHTGTSPSAYRQAWQPGNCEALPH